MLAVVQTDSGTEFNWTWMPSWIGMNRHLQERMQEALGSTLVGKTLEEAHELILDWIQQTFPGVLGLRDFLSGIAGVSLAQRDAPEGEEPMAKTERLQLRIDAEIKRRAKEIAAEQGVGLSALVEGYLRTVIQAEEKARRESEHIDAEQV